MDSESTRGTVDSQSHLHFGLFPGFEQFWHPGAGLKSQPSVTSLLPNLRPLTTFPLTSIIRVRGGLEGRALFLFVFYNKRKKCSADFYVLFYAKSMSFWAPSSSIFFYPCRRFTTKQGGEWTDRVGSE